MGGLGFVAYGVIVLVGPIWGCQRAVGCKAQPGSGYQRSQASNHRLFSQKTFPSGMLQCRQREHRDQQHERQPQPQRQRMGRLYAPFVQRYVALSQDLQGYLTDRFGIVPGRIQQIYNGVDAQLFSPSASGPTPIPGCPFAAPEY